MISCCFDVGGNCAQSSPMPKGDSGAAEPNHCRMAAIKDCSPRDATESDRLRVNSDMVSRGHAAQDQCDRVKVEQAMSHDRHDDATGAFVGQGQDDTQRHEWDETCEISVQGTEE